MKIIKKETCIKKASWFKEHEEEIFTVGCVIVGFVFFVVACFIRG